MILLLDNYDSFTWNVWQALAAHGATVEVVRNDALDVGALLALAPTGVVLSPGPGRPEDAGVMPEFLRRAPADLPILGVCLGHQALVQHHGGTIERDPTPMHGRVSLVHHDGDELFADLPNPFEAGRYHSLRARRADVPRDLRVTAWTADGVVMAVRHVTRPHVGVQFHPESLLSPGGDSILRRFVARCAARTGARA